MLHDFVTSNRSELIKRCRAKVAKRSSRIPAIDDNGVPLFLQQVVDTLRLEQFKPDATNPEPTPAPTEIGRAAALHGAELLRSGYSIDQVVHDYGDVCQSVTELAAEQDTLIAVDEFHTLNRCLDNAVADAVTAFAKGNIESLGDEANRSDKRGANVVDELLGLIDLATQTFSAIKTGSIGLTGATGSLHAKTLVKLRNLTNQSRPDIARVLGTINLPNR